jgi:predicted RND superfamily exporter protein
MELKMESNEGVTPESFFRWVVRHPKKIVLVGILFLLSMGVFLPQLKTDTRSDAFLADDNAALVYREKVKALFGLSDPVVISIVSDNTIYSIQALNVVYELTEMISDIDNIDPDGITSLATENNISGTSEGMEVTAFMDDLLDSPQQVKAIQEGVRDFPLYQGSLVAKNESATLILAELLDETKAEKTYRDLLELVAAYDLPSGLSVHVAGEGAISGYFGTYIDSDAKRLNPLAGLIITIIMFVAFLRFGVTLAGNLIVAASVLVTMAAMAILNVPLYVITNALPVILIGIAVADSIHIYSEYFDRRALHGEESINESIVMSLTEMWRPITLTTFTTVAGFLGLSLAAYMPPFQAFGYFTAIGVSVAWIYSLTFLPAVMSLLKTEVHTGLAKKIRSDKHDTFATLMVLLGRFTQRFSKSIVIAAILITVVGAISASRLNVDEDRISNFHTSEPLYQADRMINKHFDGTNYLDIVIETPQDEGMFEPAVLEKMEAMQKFALTLPHVNGATSIVDYLKQMNRSLNGGDVTYYQLPQDKDLIAQYFLLYAASSDPSDFEEEIDFDYRLANVRLVMGSGSFSDSEVVVEAMQAYINENINDQTMSATLSGRVTLTYHWIKDIGVSHFTGVLLALFLVWLVSSLLFRSALAGLYALLPVVISILLVYSTMAMLSISLGIGTSMFAAVAIGLGVDFAIHTLDRLKVMYAQTQDISKTLNLFYPTTGRALFFNLLALSLGFGVLMFSKVIPLNNFGLIVATSVFTSFLVSLTLLPALFKLFQPAFIVADKKEQNRDTAGLKAASVLLIAGAAAFIMPMDSVQAEAIPSGLQLANNINQVDDGQFVSRKMHMKMVDKRGKVRERLTLGFRQYYGDEKRTILFYLAPKNIKDTAFLTYDYTSKEDDQWLYLPALRKARRISASDRGDYFLGTDFTYEDIKKEGKVETKDYTFTTLAEEIIDGKKTYQVEGLPIDKKTAKELGYGKVQWWVDSSNWVVIKAKYWDRKLNELKTLSVSDIRLVDGIWTRHQMKSINQKTGHSTEFTFSEVDYKSKVKDSLFSRQSITRGVPR